MNVGPDRARPALELPKLCLVLLIGATSSGKSTFAARHFRPTEVLSSDRFRGLVSDDESSLEATDDAFELLHHLAATRLRRGLLTVIDATNLRPEDRKPLIALAKAQDCLVAAIVFDLPTDVLTERHEARTDRDFGEHVVRNHVRTLRRGLRGLDREGFHRTHRLDSAEAVEAATVTRVRLWNDRRDERGPFDIIGDVHGCADELRELLSALGWQLGGEVPRHPEGRRAIFVGDLVDRGPDSPGVLKLAMAMVEAGVAFCVPGNHDVKLAKKLRGRKVSVTHGLERTLEQLEREPPEFGERVAAFVERLVSHLVFDDGKLVVAHAGIKEAYQGRGSARVTAFCLYGDTTGEIDDYGLPVRLDWAREYRGKATVVYGHTPVPEAEWVNRTINLDTGCCFGGRLTALRYPENELVDVPAAREYYEPRRPLVPVDDRAGTDVLDLDDVIGKRRIDTRYARAVVIREENAAAALEVASRFAVDPRWLVYLPPTMSPSETAAAGAPWLEHPAEALGYYRGRGVGQAVLEEKHMGSRAVIVVCRTDEVAARFGARPAPGVIYTRSGRPFFRDPADQHAVLVRLRAALATAGLWDELATHWVLLDAEILPWSAKAQELIRSQYAPTGAAGARALSRSVALLEAAIARNPSAAALSELLDRTRARLDAVDRYVVAYRRYGWPVASIDDLRIAPFHLLASEGAVHVDRDHVWHMDTLARLAVDPLFVATPYRVVTLGDEVSEGEGIAWWEALTSAGGEGVVVKPRDWLVRGRDGLAQPAIKCRGPEYLRIIYGPEYTLPANLERLRARGLSRKRSLAVRELVLGLEGLHRFVAREPLYRVHECVFGVLALESEPVDPRL